jgi:hypothetical protein
VKKTQTSLPPKIGGVYRVPLRKVYNKTKKTDATWDTVYGDKKCLKCKKHFKEGDAYIIVTVWTAHKDGSASPTHKGQHVECV